MSTTTTLLLVIFLSFLCVKSQYSDDEFDIFSASSPRRIVGGSDASKGDFPYLASLRNRYDEHFCGGSIIGKYWILTAAHCVYRATERGLTVVLGSHTKNDDGQRRRVKEIILHDDLNPIQWNPDVALLRLHSPITYTDHVQPVALQTEEVKPGSEAVLVGFGDIRLRGPSPKFLQYLDLETISHEQCKKMHRRKVYKTHICTFTRHGEGACHGDSGGPLVSHGKQIGVVSWGKPCAVGKPDVFAKVSSFIDWIDEKTSEKSHDDHEDFK